MIMKATLRCYFLSKALRVTKHTKRNPCDGLWREPFTWISPSHSHGLKHNLNNWFTVKEIKQILDICSHTQAQIYSYGEISLPLSDCWYRW